MQIFGILSKHRRIIAGVIAVLVVGWSFAYEPVTRNFIALTVSDTGAGMDREVLLHACEP